MEEKKTTKISLSTFFLILAIIAICVMGYFIYKLNDDKVKATEQVSQLNNKVTLLENDKTELKAEITEYENKQTELESKENTTKENTDTNTTTQNTTNNSTVVKEIEKQLNVNDVIALGYNQVAVLINGNAYVIPVQDRDSNYENYKLYSVKNLQGKVKAIRQFHLGTDPSEANYFVMEDGSVYGMSGYGNTSTAEKILDASKKITDIIEDNGIVYAVSQNGEKTKIAERYPGI